MKKCFLSILAFLMVSIMLFSVIGCDSEPDLPGVSTGDPTESVSEQTTDATESDSEPTTDVTDCTHAYTEAVEVPAKALKEGTKRFTCSNCGDSYTEGIPATKTLKILAIGNSFSVDAMQYLWDIAKNGGVETVILGNLYIGGCALRTHANNIKGASKAYTYYKNTAGTWTETSGKSVQDGLADEDWDIITVQQASGSSGLASTYNDLDYILNFLAKSNPDADVYWHMTWAYQQNSTHRDFSNYGSNQMTMYNKILNAVDTEVKTQESICGIIPSGTAIQNLRTSYIGDTITRDGYHMSYDYGRYTLALTWYEYFTGGDAADIDWLPASYSTVIKPHLPAILEAVKAAIEKPFEITKVKAKNPVTTNPTTDEERIALIGYNINDFVELDWALEVNAYYNSTVRIGIYNAQTSTASNIPNFIASHLFKKENLPVGTIIIVDSGYQYRPEGWINENTKNTSSSRPGNVTATVLEVTEAWWGNYTIRAFNLSATVPRRMTEGDIQHLRIYLPKSANPVPVDP